MTSLRHSALAVLALVAARMAHGAAIAWAPSTPGVLQLSPDDPSVIALKAASPPRPEVIVLSDSDLVSDEIHIASIPQSSFPGTITEEELLMLANNTSSSVTREQEKRQIIGTDDRQLFSDTNWPFRTVGKWVASNAAGEAWMCTGTLVGPRHMLTAGHCAVNVASASFMPGYDNAPRFGTAYPTVIVRIDSTGEPWACGAKRDWAIVVLDRRIGETVGFVGTVRNPREDTWAPSGDLVTIGYPGDKDGGQRPYRMRGIRALKDYSLTCDVTGPLVSTAHVSGGQSGSPLWQPQVGSQNRWILGVVSSVANVMTVSASGSEMVDSLARIKMQYP